MNHNYIFRNVNEALPALCKSMLNFDEVGSRNGRVLEMTHVGITLTHPWERYITVPGRHASLPAQVAETMWILAGRNDIEWLSHYLPRAAEFSDDGKTWRGGYGPRLRAWPADEYNGPAYADAPIDQLKHVVELLKAEPLTRRAVMAIYNPAIDYQGGKDIPCNDFIQFMSRLGKLDMHVFIRSNDLMWGWSGINAFEWSALQEIVAQLLGIGVGHLHFSISSLHLYDRHWKKAEELSRADVLDMPHDPQFKSRMPTVGHLDMVVAEWFRIEEIIRTDGPSKALQEIIDFPEPMFQDWLVVIAKYHDPDFHWDTADWPQALCIARQASPKKPEYVQTVEPATDWSTMTPFVAYVDNLHREKHKAYGDSWKRRGEMLGIMANIARKIDRLGHDGGGDTATDTAVDTLVYLIKYRIWLDEQVHGAADTDETDRVLERLMELSDRSAKEIQSPRNLEAGLIQQFEVLEHQVEEKRVTRYQVVDLMILIAFDLASHLWWKDQNATRAFTGYPS